MIGASVKKELKVNLSEVINFIPPEIIILVYELINPYYNIVFIIPSLGNGNLTTWHGFH